MMKELIEEALEEGGVEGGRRNIYRILKENTMEAIKLQFELRSWIQSKKYCQRKRNCN